MRIRCIPTLVIVAWLLLLASSANADHLWTDLVFRHVGPGSGHPGARTDMGDWGYGAVAEDLLMLSTEVQYDDPNSAWDYKSFYDAQASAARSAVALSAGIQNPGGGANSGGVSSVDMASAMMYCNWLHGGGGSMTATELWKGGAYDLDLIFGTDMTNHRFLDSQQITIEEMPHKPGALFWIPSMTEWFAGGYRQGNADLADDWNDYPNGTDTAPASNSLSTNDLGLTGMARGVFEYTSTVVWEPYPGYGNYGVTLGGLDWSWGGADAIYSMPPGLTYFEFGNFAGYNSHVGFRVAASVPEPTSVGLLLMAFGGSLWCRRQRR